MSEPVSRVAIELAASAAKMPPSCFKALLCLLRYRGANATAYPSVGTISRECGLGERTAQLAMQALRSAGWIRRVPGDHRAPDWALLIGSGIEKLTPSHWKARPRGADLAPQGAMACGVQGLAAMGARACALGVQALAPDSSIEPSKDSSINTTHPHAPAHEATDTPEVDGRAGVDAGPVPEQTPPRRPLPIRPVPFLPPADPPPAPPSACQNERRTGRSNLAALPKHHDEDLPMPEPDDVPVYELPDLLRPGESVALPGTLDELLADARGMGRHIIGALRAAGIATTQELFERLPLESVPFTRGLSGARGNELIQHLGDRWCVFLRTKDDIDAINAKTVYAADRRRNATQEARAGLRLVGGEK